MSSLVLGCVFNMVAGVLHVLTKAANGAAAGSGDGGENGCEKEDGEALLGCFHMSIFVCLFIG